MGSASMHLFLPLLFPLLFIPKLPAQIPPGRSRYAAGLRGIWEILWGVLEKIRDYSAWRGLGSSLIGD